MVSSVVDPGTDRLAGPSISHNADIMDQPVRPISTDRAVPSQGTGESIAVRFAPALLSGLIFIASLAVTYGMWRTAQQDALRNLQVEFNFRVIEMVDRIEQRMATYEQVLRGTQAFLAGSIDVKRGEFRSYIAALNLDARYPGLQGIAIAQLLPDAAKVRHTEALRADGFPEYAIRPDDARPLFSAITRIEPYSGLNPRAIGFDMLTEPVRRAAMERSRDSGEAAASGKVILVQETGATVQAGFVMYFPVFRRGVHTLTMEQRRADILGWIGAPFRMDDLMAGLGGKRSSDLHVKIFDGDVISLPNQLYDSAALAADAKIPPPMFSEMRQVRIAGRAWTLSIASGAAFERKLDSGKSEFVAVAGIGTGLLLALLVWALATGRVRALTLATDMTSELRASEYRWKYALEGAGDGVWDWNIDTSEVIFSRRWKEMLGYVENDVPHRFPEWERLIHPLDLPHASASVKNCLNGDTPTYASEFRVRCKDGSWKWILGRGMVVQRDADGKPLRMIGTHSDITERKDAERLEAERIHSLDANRTALQHAKRLEAVGKLTGGVAHDFNNVLQIISSNLSLLERYVAGNDPATARVANAAKAVSRGAKLSSQLLSFARRQPLEPKVVNTLDVVNAMRDMLRQAVGESITIEITAADALWNTVVDPHQLENVILNLALNARDAMDGKGVLTFDMHNAELDAAFVATYADVVPGEYAVLSISDTGTGMTSAVREQVFEPFFTTKPAGEGTGLGLSMAYGFVKQSGGHIEIASEPGAGTTFTIYLPRSLEQQTEVIGLAIGTAMGGSETILVVEDDAEVQGAVIAMLTELGYRVLKADNADSALSIVNSKVHIDMLFTDIVMPGALRGPDLAQRVKLISPDIAVLFTSGYTQDTLMQSSRLDPSVNLLSKPYRRDELARKIRAVFAKKA